MERAGGDQFALLVNRKKRLTILAGTRPPRLCIAPQQMPGLEDEGRVQRRSISDDEAGQLIAGDANWACLDVVGAVCYLIDSWCERRCLGPLGQILQAWPPNGLTDGANELLNALQLGRAAGCEVVTPFESELLSAAESKLSAQLKGGLTVAALLTALNDLAGRRS
jgi:hypothetical protein